MTASTGKSRYVCAKCQGMTDTWVARCPHCQSWSSSSEEVVRSPTTRPVAPTRGPTLVRDVTEDDEREQENDDGPVPITDVECNEHVRFSTGLPPLDLVLGGGMVVNGVVLLGGDPGIGKSTLLIQMLASSSCERVLYATGEETRQQVTMRARRVDAAKAKIHIVAETDIDKIVAYATQLDAQLVAIDSVQTMSTNDLESPAGSVAQVKECTARVVNYCKGHGSQASAIFICHVNKAGDHAGPNTLMHLVDAVFSFSRDPDLEQVRIITASKNRYGSTTNRGAFEMGEHGLVSVPVSVDVDREEQRASKKARDGEFQPMAQELLRRFVELGGVVDDALRDRIGGRLEGVPEATR